MSRVLRVEVMRVQVHEFRTKISDRRRDNNGESGTAVEFDSLPFQRMYGRKRRPLWGPQPPAGTSLAHSEEFKKRGSSCILGTKRHGK